MSNPQLSYFQDEDILHLSLSDEPEAGSVEISPDITAELNENGDLIGIEILAASAFLRDSILESAQAKLLGLRSFPNPCFPKKQQPSIKKFYGLCADGTRSETLYQAENQAGVDRCCVGISRTH